MSTTFDLTRTADQTQAAIGWSVVLLGLCPTWRLAHSAEFSGARGETPPFPSSDVFSHPPRRDGRTYNSNRLGTLLRRTHTACTFSKNVLCSPQSGSVLSLALLSASLAAALNHLHLNETPRVLLAARQPQERPGAQSREVLDDLGQMTAGARAWALRKRHQFSGGQRNWASDPVGQSTSAVVAVVAVGGSCSSHLASVAFQMAVALQKHARLELRNCDKIGQQRNSSQSSSARVARAAGHT